MHAAVTGRGSPGRQAPAEQVVARVAASESGATAEQVGAASHRRGPGRQAPAEQAVAQLAASESGATAEQFGAARNRVPLGTSRLLAQRLGKPIRTGVQAGCQGFAYSPLRLTIAHK